MTSAQNIFKDAMDRVLPLVTKDPYVESAWLKLWSELEASAIRQAVENISAATPTEFLPEIHQHIQDELSHAADLRDLAPHKRYPKLAYYHLEHDILATGDSYITAYFSQDLLKNLKNRHEAYI